MCGIAGILGQSGINQKAIHEMEESISHRGPDDSGVWINETNTIALIHRRLSILDLSPAGKQPMRSNCGRYTIIFNGEIYNHLSIKEKLTLNFWRGHSDTETLLASIVENGLEKTLQSISGMFALALWDEEDQTLYLARDRFGEKPLYYGWQDDVFLFGSEIKALKRHAKFKHEIDHSSVMQFMCNGYVPGPQSIYKGINKLPQGTWLKVSLKSQEIKSGCYWSLKETTKQAQSYSNDINDTQAIQQLDTLLSQSIDSQMISDVPIGAFLSGGIDSSTIVALMQASSTNPINTFALGYSDKRYNEAHYAKAVAKHLSTHHTELYITHEDAISVIPDLPQIYCEPFADTSQIPTYLISKLAAQQVKVALSGDAGDELFGGYNHYRWVAGMWPKVKKIPKPLRHLLSTGLNTLSPDIYNYSYEFIRKLLGHPLTPVTASNRVETLSTFLRSNNLIDAYYALIANQVFANQVVINSNQAPFTTNNPSLKLDDAIHQMMYLDSTKFLTDDILVKTDRAAMAVGLETRVPMLDENIVKFIWSQPSNRKIRNGQSKWLLRQVLLRYVPSQLIDRPKMGFGVPIDEWLRGPLRGWAEHLLDKNRIRNSGLLNEKYVQQLWSQHLNKKYNWSNRLWRILMFQAWLDAN